MKENAWVLNNLSIIERKIVGEVIGNCRKETLFRCDSISRLAV